MNQTGIYEQLITQLVEKNLDRQSFFVGERKLETGEAATFLSRFLTRIIEIAMDSVPNGDTKIHEQIDLANTIVKWLSRHIKDEELITENLLDSQGKILTALFDKANPISADLPKYVDAIMPITGLTQSELFCGSNVGISLETEIKREIQSSDKIYYYEHNKPIHISIGNDLQKHLQVMNESAKGRRIPGKKAYENEAIQLTEELKQ